MIKLVYCVKRRADVAPEAFRKHWLENHGPLVRSVAEATRALKYVQSHTVQDEAINEAARAPRGAGAPYDGITEIWWADADTLLEGAESPEGQAAYVRLIEDESTFVDLAASSLFFTEEHTVFDRTGDA